MNSSMSSPPSVAPTAILLPLPTAASESTLESDFLADDQILILRVVRTCSSFLSVLGSLLIISHVCRRRRRGIKANPKNRLLIGLSASDLLFSFQNFIFTPLVYPILEPSPVCSLDAWIHLFGNAAAYYNAALSFYFLAVIRWNVRDQEFAKTYEPFCHLLPIFFAVTAATLGAIMDIYNPKASGLGCWVEDWPRGCSDSDLDLDETNVEIECRGDATIMKLFPTIAVVCPFLVALLTMIVSNVLIYQFVRRLERRNARYSVTASVVATNNDNSRMDSEQPNLQQRRSSATTDMRRSTQRRASFVHACTRSITLDESDASHSARRGSVTPAASVAQSPDYTRSKKIATQSFCYIAAFFACYLPGVIFWVSGFIYPEGQTNGNMFWLQVINALFFPAQGFFNMIVYLRPQYQAWREAVPDKGICYAWRMAILLKSAPAPKRRRPSPPALQDSNGGDGNDTTGNATTSNTIPEDTKDNPMAAINNVNRVSDRRERGVTKGSGGD